MPDFDAITTALAARYAAGQVTPPGGYQNIRLSTGDLPNQIAALPCVLIFPTEGAYETGQGTRIGAHEFVVRFYYAQTGDLIRHMVALRKWLTVLGDQLRTSVQLGGAVTTARTMGWRIGVLPYARRTYVGIELQVHIVTTEGWAAAA